MRKIVLIIAALLATVLLAGRHEARAQHAADMLIGSTADRGGALTVQYDFTRKVRTTLSISAGGVSFYTAVDPGFDAATSTTQNPPVYPLRNNTSVSLQVIELDPGVSLKVRNTTLTAAGDSALIGTSPNLHEHPQWRLTVADDVLGEFRLRFRLTTTSASYQSSATYTAVVTNLANDPTPSATPSASATPTPSTLPTVTPTPSLSATVAIATSTTTPTATATPTTTTAAANTNTATPSPTATPPTQANLDTNCDGRISAADVLAVLLHLAGRPGECSADANGDGRVDEADRERVESALFQIAKYPI